MSNNIYPDRRVLCAQGIPNFRDGSLAVDKIHKLEPFIAAECELRDAETAADFIALLSRREAKL